MVRSPLVWLDCVDPLDTAKAVQAVDPAKEELAAFLVAAAAAYPSPVEFAAAQMVKKSGGRRQLWRRN
jgi:hypothetical protein